jgi:hypothetical protein
VRAKTIDSAYEIAQMILSRDDVILRIKKSKTLEEAAGWQAELRALNAKLGLDTKKGEA